LASKLRRPGGNSDLPFAGIRQLVGSSLQSEGDNSNRNRGQRGNDPSRLVENLSDLDADEWNELIRGAVFLFGFFDYFAYFVVTTDERKAKR
jgi:hypothetical protein